MIPQKKLKVELACEPTTSFLYLWDVYLLKYIFQIIEIRVLKRNCVLMCIATTFTIVRGYNQCKCPLTAERLKTIWSVHKMECYQALKEWNFDMCYTTHKPWQHYVTWNKSVIKRQLLDYYVIPQWEVKLIKTESRIVLLGNGRFIVAREREVIVVSHFLICLLFKQFLILIVCTNFLLLKYGFSSARQSILETRHITSSTFHFWMSHLRVKMLCVHYVYLEMTLQFNREAGKMTISKVLSAIQAWERKCDSQNLSLNNNNSNKSLVRKEAPVTPALARQR